MHVLKKKSFFYPLVLLTLAACTDWEAKTGKDGNGAQSHSGNLQIPKKKSELNGWQGLMIKKKSPTLCKLIFPESYGLANEEELLVLRKLANANLDHDLDCVLQVNSAALDQIRLLAVKKQDFNAAKMLLTPSSYGGFDLDGELAEEYAGEYQLPVIDMTNSALVILKDKKIAEEVSDSLCSWIEALGEKDDEKMLRRIVVNLRKKKLTEFSNLLSLKCGNVFE